MPRQHACPRAAARVQLLADPGGDVGPEWTRRVLPPAMPAERRQARTAALRDRTAVPAGTPGTPGTGENICPDCSGSGQLEGRTCPTCNGTGRVVQPVGGA